MTTPAVTTSGVGVRVRAPADPARVAAAVVAAGWVVVLFRDGVEHAGRFAARPVAAAAACGIALLVAASKPTERDGRDVATLVAVWVATTLGVIGGVGDPSVIPLALGLAAAAVAIVVGDGGEHPLQATLVVTGAALVVAAVAVAGEHAARFDASAFVGAPVAVALAIAGAVVTLAAAVDGDRPALTVLAVPALAVAAVVAPAAGSDDAAVIPVAIVAVAAAWFDRRSLAVGATAIAAIAAGADGGGTAAAFLSAATTTDAMTAGLLLAAATVVVIAVPSSPALLAAAPGAAALAVHAAHQPTTASVAIAVTAGLVAVLLTVGRDLRPTTIPLRTIPAALAGVHLALAPTTWRWAGTDDDLAHWDRGIAVAVAAALLAAVVAVQTGTVPFPHRDPHEPATDAEPPATPTTTSERAGRASRALVAAIVALGLAMVALVRSSLRSVP